MTDPYPDFAQLPARPAPTDPAARRALSARLSSERDRTARLAEQDPIEAPGPRSIPPQPAPGGLARSAGSPDAGAAPQPAAAPPMARLEAAEARPDAAAAPAPAVSPAPAGGQAANPPAASRRPAAPVAPAAAGDGALPALPTGAPPLPTLPGLPSTAFEPATPKPAPQVDADFVSNSAVLRPASADALRQLAARRSGGNVAVLGGGDARSASPDAQVAALPLAWQRARAIQKVLTTAGVPTAAMRVDAAALARGGIARLVD